MSFAPVARRRGSARQLLRGTLLVLPAALVTLLVAVSYTHLTLPTNREV